jgi:hypothetical protein
MADARLVAAGATVNFPVPGSMLEGGDAGEEVVITAAHPHPALDNAPRHRTH